MTKKKKVVTASWHTGSANSIAPVAAKLLEDDKVDILVVARGSSSQAVFQRKGISYEIIASYGLEDVSPESMKRLLEAESPDLVLVGTSAQDAENPDVIEQTLTLAAKELGIRSLAVVDFWGNIHLRFSDILTGERFKFLPSRIAVLDAISFQEYLNGEFPKERLVITGNPYFDNLADKARNFTEAQKHAIRKEISPTGDLLLFFAGSIFKVEKKTFGFWDLDVLKLIMRALKDIPVRKVSLVVKLHPQTPASDKEEIVRYIGRSLVKVRLVETIGTQDLILATDITLISVSTVGAEALLMGKPCVSLQPGLRKKDEFILSARGIVPVGYTSDACLAEIRRIISDDQGYRSMLLGGAQAIKTDGKATGRVVELVYEMLN